jgi:hypothetical protein
MPRRIMTAIARALGETSTDDTKHYHAAPLGHGYVCHDSNCTSPNRHTDIA